MEYECQQCGRPDFARAQALVDWYTSGGQGRLDALIAEADAIMNACQNGGEEESEQYDGEAEEYWICLDSL